MVYSLFTFSERSKIYFVEIKKKTQTFSSNKAFIRPNSFIFWYAFYLKFCRDFPGFISFATENRFLNMSNNIYESKIDVYRTIFETFLVTWAPSRDIWNETLGGHTIQPKSGSVLKTGDRPFTLWLFCCFFGNNRT